MICPRLLALFLLVVVHLLACTPSKPIPVIISDASLGRDAEIVVDMAVADASVDAEVVDMMNVDAGIPEYVEELAPNVPPNESKLTVIGQGDIFEAFWWRGGRMWSRRMTANRMPPLTDDAQSEVELTLEEPKFLRFIPPYQGSTRVLRAVASNARNDEHLVVEREGSWRLLPLSDEQDYLLPFDQGHTLIGEHDYGPTDEKLGLILGLADGRAATVQPRAPDSLNFVGERNAPMPTLFGAMGHLWILAYADGHCASFASERGLGDEVGNWLCFSDQNTFAVGGESLASDGKGPVFVKNTSNQIHIWDPRPGIVTAPSSITPASEPMEMSSELPDGWRMHTELGHQILTTDNGILSYHGRRGQDLVYVVDSGELSFWILVSRHSIVVTRKLPTALSAMLALGTDPIQLLWDGVDGQLNAVAVTDFVSLPILPIEPAPCASRSPESCGLADADCDGESEAGLCCPFTYSHSEVSTLEAAGEFQGPWFVSKSDLGALLAFRRNGAAELMHLSNQNQQCFACANQVGEILHFTHTESVVGVIANVEPSSGSCPATCSLSIDAIEAQNQANSTDENLGGEAGAEGNQDEPTPSTSGVDPVLIVHPRPGELVVRTLACAPQFLASAVMDGGVRLLVMCQDQALEYLIVDGVLDEMPTRIDLGVGGLEWVGPQTRSIRGGRFVTEWLTADGETKALRRWSYGYDGIIEELLPDTLNEMSENDRALPIRFPITEHGLITRLSVDGLGIERWTSVGWIAIPTHLWVEDIQFSKYDDFAISLVALRDPNQAGFDPIEQTLAVYGHDLNGFDSPWGQYLELESSPILGYSFQGVVLPEWDQNTLEPYVWWSIGRSTVAPTIKRRGLSCRPTTRFESSKLD